MKTLKLNWIFTLVFILATASGLQTVRGNTAEMLKIVEKKPVSQLAGDIYLYGPFGFEGNPGLHGKKIRLSILNPYDAGIAITGEHFWPKGEFDFANLFYLSIPKQWATLEEVTLEALVIEEKISASSVDEIYYSNTLTVPINKDILANPKKLTDIPAGYDMPVYAFNNGEEEPSLYGGATDIPGTNNITWYPIYESSLSNENNNRPGTQSPASNAAAGGDPWPRMENYPEVEPPERFQQEFTGQQWPIEPVQIEPLEENLPDGETPDGNEPRPNPKTAGSVILHSKDFTLLILCLCGLGFALEIRYNIKRKLYFS